MTQKWNIWENPVKTRCNFLYAINQIYEACFKKGNHYVHSFSVWGNFDVDDKILKLYQLTKFAKGKFVDSDMI